MELCFICSNILIGHIPNDFVYFRDGSLDDFKNLERVLVDDIKGASDLIIRHVICIGMALPSGDGEYREWNNNSQDQDSVKPSDRMQFSGYHSPAPPGCRTGN